MRILLVPTVSFITLVFFSYGSTTREVSKQINKHSVVEFIKDTTEKKVDIKVAGKLFLSYYWPDSVFKPMLYPVYTAAGTEITRGYPIKPRYGERPDHRHQVGIWMNYGNVNGYDFWGNGAEGVRKVNVGHIKHLTVDQFATSNNEGSMVATASWRDPNENELLKENTTFHFIADGSTRIIDRITTLTATHGKVDFTDTKEGFLGMRLVRQLELPSNEKTITLTDVEGNPEIIETSPNSSVTGNYLSSEGITCTEVWGTRAKWMNLYGSIGEEKISLIICDHPENISYPTYWHARGYGLFAVNPFGVKDFTKGKEALNYSFAPGQSLTLKYRIIISSGAHLNEIEINKYSDDFAKKY